MSKLTAQVLERSLRANPRAKATRICALLDIDQSTLSRALRKLPGQVVSLGRASRTRYAWRRPIRGRERALPLYRIDRHGVGAHVGDVDFVYPGGSAVRMRTGLGWPVDDDMRDGWYDGLPYWLADMRPQGFLGRHFARRNARALQIAEDPNAWSDDDVVHILATAGGDLPGNLVLGDASYEALVESARRLESSVLGADQVAEAYPRLAMQTLAHGHEGSSAGGEFPKFTACRTVEGEPKHMIVKFSGAGGSPAETRWSDLLVSEHIALECLQESLGVPAARSRVHMHSGRTFMEVERFDRHGLRGRSEICSLLSIDAALIGSAAANWTVIAEALYGLNHLDDRQVAVIRLAWWFGRLIGNADMHLGNLAFAPGLIVTPAYDMLPMRYAPARGGELPETEFEVPEPLPREGETWQQAAGAAASFWSRCASDARISEDFRKLSGRNELLIVNALQENRRHGDMEPEE